jgi:DNA-binding transcriptional ArsR family regulator
MSAISGVSRDANAADLVRELPVACAAPCAEQQRVEAARALLFDDATYAHLADIFRALGDATRAKIVSSLLRQELCTCDLAALTGISESAVSQHLRVLRSLRLVRSRRRGKLVFHALDDAHIAILLQVGLSHVRDGDAMHPTMERLLTHLQGSRA